MFQLYPQAPANGDRIFRIGLELAIRQPPNSWRVRVTQHDFAHRRAVQGKALANFRVQADAEVSRFDLVEINADVVVANAERSHLPGCVVQGLKMRPRDAPEIIVGRYGGPEARQQQPPLVAP